MFCNQDLMGLNHGVELIKVYKITHLTTSSLYFSPLSPHLYSHPRPHEVRGEAEACQGAERGKGQISG